MGARALRAPPDLQDSFDQRLDPMPIGLRIHHIFPGPLNHPGTVIIVFESFDGSVYV